MKGNEKIPITAEAVALMRSRAGDRFSRHFVTPRIKKLDAFVRRLFSEDLLSHTFARRLSLARDMEDAVRYFKPKRIVDLGAGYTTFNTEYALTYPDCEIVEVDFPSVVSSKQEKLKQIRRLERLGRVPNLHFVPADIVQDNLPHLLKKYLSSGDKTLVYSVGVNTYLNSGQNTAMLKNVLAILDQSNCGSAYLSHDPTRVQIDKTASVGGKILRGFVSVLTGNRQYIHYSSERDLKRKLLDVGFGEVEIVKKRPDNTIYLARK